MQTRRTWVTRAQGKLYPLRSQVSGSGPGVGPLAVQLLFRLRVLARGSWLLLQVVLSGFLRCRLQPETPGVAMRSP